MDYLLNLAILNGLELTNLDNINKGIIDLPNDIFGVYVTINRTTQSNNENYKNKIHGCIGYWNSNFNLLSLDKIIEYIKHLSHKATWEDPRSKFFDNIFRDSQAEFEITFMLNEIYEVDTNGYCNKLNNYYNNNSNYGILVLDINNNKSTFLPKIFNKDWDTIKKTLLQNAKIKSNSYQFLCYNTMSIKKKIYKILENNIFDFAKVNYVEFINDYYKNDIPNTVDSDDNIIYLSNDVEILSFINNLYEVDIYIDDHIIDKIKELIEHYKNKYVKNKKGFRQASTFLLQILSKKYKDDSNKYFSKLVCNYLVNSMDWLDKNFEKPEALVSICYNSPNEYKRFLIESRNKILKEIIPNNYKIEDIFAYNWQTKLLNTMYMLFIETDNNIKQHSIVLIERILKILDKLYENKETDVSYYIISFESLCNLLIFIFEEENIKKKVLNNIIYLTKLLMDKYNYKYGLFESNDGSCKVSLTEHFINGITSLNYSINYINNN